MKYEFTTPAGSIACDDRALAVKLLTALLSSLDDKRTRCVRTPNPERKIEAIKSFRNATQCGLADAKEWVEGTRNMLLSEEQAAHLRKQGFELEVLP